MNTFRIVAIVLASITFATTHHAEAAKPGSNQAPIVSLTSPQAGSSFLAPATITIAASASDPDGTVTKHRYRAIHLYMAKRCSRNVHPECESDGQRRKKHDIGQCVNQGRVRSG